MVGPIICIAEHRDGTLLPVSLEVAAFARELGELFQAEVIGVVLGSDIKALAEDFSAHTGIDVIAVNHPGLTMYSQEAYIAALDQLSKKYQPLVIATAHTSIGWDYMPGLAERIG